MTQLVKSPTPVHFQRRTDGHRISPVVWTARAGRLSISKQLGSAGHLGCRHSGLAFTSERQLLAGAIPRVPQEPARLTSRNLPFAEPSATIVWRVLNTLGIASETILWNALQMHPHKPGDPRTNRTPTTSELMQGAPAMRLLVEAFPHAQIVAVGRKAELLLQEMGIAVVGQVRHPANGGARAFEEGLAALMAGAAK